jgi:regulatory protein
LEAAGIFYLARYAASAARVRRVLLRRVQRSALYHGTAAEDGARLVEELIRRWIDLKMIDDRAFAEMQVRRLARRGAGRKRIEMKLRESGIDQELARESLAGTGDLAAAAIFVRRRRIGPYRDAETRAAWRDKDLAKLGRSGFDRQTAARVIDAADAEAAERLASED